MVLEIFGLYDLPVIDIKNRYWENCAKFSDHRGGKYVTSPGILGIFNALPYTNVGRIFTSFLFTISVPLGFKPKGCLNSHPSRCCVY